MAIAKRPTPTYLRIAGPVDTSHLDYKSDSSLESLLLRDRQRYSAQTGDPWLSFYSFPSTVRLNLDRIRTQTSHGRSSRRIGINPTICCALDEGMKYLLERHELKSLSVARIMFENAQSSIDGDVQAVLSDFFKWNKFEINMGDSKERINVATPPEIYGPVSAVADSVNADISFIGLVAILHSLSEQHECNDDHRDEFKRHVHKFLRWSGIRARLLNCALREFNL